MTSTPTLLAFARVTRRQGALVALATVLGLTAGHLLAWALPPRFSAAGLVRVASIFPPGLPLVDAATLATEASHVDLGARARERTGVAHGEVTVGALHRTELVEVRAVAATPAEAERLVDAATAELVETQARLASSVLQGGTAQGVLRPAARVEPLGKGRPAAPTPGGLLAVGTALGLAIGLLAAAWREARRPGLHSPLASEASRRATPA